MKKQACFGPINSATNQLMLIWFWIDITDMSVFITFKNYNTFENNDNNYLKSCMDNKNNIVT